MTMSIRLHTCTLTGVDDSTVFYDLSRLSRMYPFVEWGFLYSPKYNELGGRYPCIVTLNRAFQTLPEHVRVALHICGSGVHNPLAGEKVVNDLVEMVAKRRGRVQLNFNQTAKPVDLNLIRGFLNRFPDMQVITQHNNANETLWKELEGFSNHAVLFDASGGRGLLGNQWPEPLSGVACGYAGGLGPDNLSEQLDRIAAVVQQGSMWVDMESSLRITSDGDRLDIDRCEDCLLVVSEWMRLTCTQ